LFLLGLVFTTFVATLSLYVGTLRAARVTHSYLLTKIMRAPMSFFDQTPIGRIINRFSKDTEAVDSDLPATLRAFTACFFGVLKNTFGILIWNSGKVMGLVTNERTNE